MSTPAAASSSPDAPVDLPRLPIAFRGDGWTADEKRHTETCVAHYYHQVLVSVREKGAGEGGRQDSQAASKPLGVSSMDRVVG